MSAKLNELRSDIDELSELVKQSKRKRVQDILSLEIRKLETEWVSLKEKEEKAQQSGTSTEAAASSSVVAPKRYQTKINGYGWDQSEKYVKVFVTLKNVHNVPKENIYCNLTERCMVLHVDDLEGKDYVLTINKLLEPIIVKDCHWKQKTDMVVIFLLKANPNIKWSHMTEMDKKSDDQHKNRFKPDDDMMNKRDPQESIMGLMKNMYETGDDEMKRMISKAWYEGQHKKKSDTVDF